ncbi:MAG: trypsin-like peptidase domain-containing protein, partial [Desulfuromusa sp.]|nr:trypsin-like peptidase domain-containing protein [Desulfuromusa sp.]
MKICQICSQSLAEQIKSCPSCGSDVADGIESVDNYRILEVVHEGYASILCRAIREEDETPVALRLFTSESGVNETVAERLKKELEALQKLPEEWFVQHHSIQQSSDGMWYRVSEWLDAESWGDLLSSGRLQDPEVAYDLFGRLAAILDGLHQSGHFIPHLILNDILVIKGEPGRIDVKVDYKLSRFLDPKRAQPGPMLQNLLVCHPDIVENRPLNFKSDIWSLGRIFAQVLSGDLDLCDPYPIVTSEDFPKEIGVLIRSMLLDDPDMRPRSMAEIAEALKRISEKVPEAVTEPVVETVGQIRRLKKAVVIISIVFGVLVAAGGLVLYQFNRKAANVETAMAEYADQYAGSVAFVMVEYTVKVDNMTVYRQRTEGTAFLVDSAGYLLTNRHVACPWLEDEGLFPFVERIRAAGKTPRFNYQMYLWFEGDTAFNRLYGLGSGGELEDIYDIASAHSRGGQPDIKIAGVAKAPTLTGQRIRAPLRDDFAVLKINQGPRGLLPLPLDKNLDTSNLKRLSPVIALGFPLGSRTQEDTINVSVTRGHIRRTFENFFQVDTSIYRGNSGGPIIDSEGKVIGIASAVATDMAVAPMPVITPLSDIGLVLPVTKAAVFIDELKNGQYKWNGVIDFSVASKIDAIKEAAANGNWVKALELSNQSLEESNDPFLLTTAAMIHFCTGDPDGAAELFDKSLSIDAENDQAHLMHYLTNRYQGRGLRNTHLRHLINLNWRSSGEFYGYLAKILSAAVDTKIALTGWNSPGEKGWLLYIVGLLELDKARTEEARALFKEAALVSDRDEWSFYLALSELDRLAQLQVDGEAQMQQFRVQLDVIEHARLERHAQTAVLITRLQQAAGDPTAQRDLILEILAIEPENRY